LRGGKETPTSLKRKPQGIKSLHLRQRKKKGWKEAVVQMLQEVRNNGISRIKSTCKVSRKRRGEKAESDTNGLPGGTQE